MSADRPAADGAQRAHLLCADVRPDLVALMRDELSPLRAESVRAHLVACPECREESFELDVATRSYAKLPDLEPPVDLITRSLTRLGAGLPIGPQPPVSRASAPVARPASRAQAPSEDAAPEGETPARTGILFRPVTNRFARMAVAALFLAMAFAFSIPSVAEALGRAEQRLMGPELSEKLHEATENFLMRFFL